MLIIFFIRLEIKNQNKKKISIFILFDVLILNEFFLSSYLYLTDHQHIWLALLFLCLSTELFSVPTLTMHPAEVFQNDNMTLICKSRSHFPKRLNENDMKYSLVVSEVLSDKKRDGVFSIKAPHNESNYSCVVEAKNIVKRSEILTVHPKGNSNVLVKSEKVPLRQTSLSCTIEPVAV